MLQTHWKPHSFIQQTFTGCPPCARDCWPGEATEGQLQSCRKGKCVQGASEAQMTAMPAGVETRDGSGPLEPWLVKRLRKEGRLQRGSGQEGWIWFSLGKKGNENTQNWTQTGHTKVTVAQSDREPGLSHGEQGSAWQRRTHCSFAHACQHRFTHSVPSTWESCCSFPNNLTTGKTGQGSHTAGGTGFMLGPGQTFQLFQQSWVQAELYHLLPLH